MKKECIKFFLVVAVVWFIAVFIASMFENLRSYIYMLANIVTIVYGTVYGIISSRKSKKNNENEKNN